MTKKVGCLYQGHTSSTWRAARTDPPDPLSPPVSSIASGRFSRLYPVSVQSCCILFLVRRPAFARPCEDVHKSISLMNSSVLLQQCPTCLVCLTLIAFEMWGRWPYSHCFVGCCLQYVRDIAGSILVYLPSSFFS